MHIASAVGDSIMVRALLSSAEGLSHELKTQTDFSDLLPVDLALVFGHLLCARDLGFHLMSNLAAVRQRCEYILALQDAPEADDPNREWTSELDVQEVRINIQTTDSERITVLRDLESSLASSLAISRVSRDHLLSHILYPPPPRIPPSVIITTAHLHLLSHSHSRLPTPRWQDEAADLLLRHAFDPVAAREAFLNTRRRG